MSDFAKIVELLRFFFNRNGLPLDGVELIVKCRDGRAAYRAECAFKADTDPMMLTWGPQGPTHTIMDIPVKFRSKEYPHEA